MREKERKKERKKERETKQSIQYTQPTRLTRAGPNRGHGGLRRGLVLALDEGDVVDDIDLAVCAGQVPAKPPPPARGARRSSCVLCGARGEKRSKEAREGGGGEVEVEVEVEID